TQKKTVSLGFSGAGKRPVRVGYVVERPIWKTSYRLLLEPNNKVFLQGWALVENTSDDDWNNVRMVLVSGRPISFKMNLYEPLYIPRPTVEPALFASLRPPVYTGAMDESKPMEKAKNGGGPSGGSGGRAGFGFAIPRAEGGEQSAKKRIEDAREPEAQKMLSLQGKLRYEELAQRLQEQKKEAKAEAGEAGRRIAGLDGKQGITSVATALEIGDQYQFILDQKITLPRQKSA